MQQNPTRLAPSNPQDKHWQQALAALLTFQEASNYLATPISSLRTPAFRMRIGLPTVKLGKAVRFRRVDLDRVIARGLQRLPGEEVAR
ncbi:MAG: helix-turn-helix domain-containing protein [candidate division NC10 bacterium]|nr:helix-turn-helix domain-containing protein [candidate division NC10 bacterium]